jgi:hypothetical protein
MRVDIKDKIKVKPKIKRIKRKKANDEMIISKENIREIGKTIFEPDKK